MSDKKALVALAKEASIQDSVTKVFDLMGGVTNMIKPGTTVMLKPNAGHASPADTSVCTNPEVVRAVIREVKKANPKSIVIAEAAAIGCDTMECYEVSGIADVAREEGVELYDIKADKDLINVAVLPLQPPSCQAAPPPAGGRSSHQPAHPEGARQHGVLLRPEEY